MDQLIQEDKFTKWFPYGFGAFWSVAVIVYLFSITFLEIPEANKQNVNTILGFLLGSLLSGIIQFIYGANKASQERDKIAQEAIAIAVKKGADHGRE